MPAPSSPHGTSLGPAPAVQKPQKTKVNPLSRRPKSQRLVMAVRGGAGVGKSHFIRSMTDAGLGRLCIFDVERKTRLLKGVGEQFDGLEIERSDELPEFIEWALTGEGREQSYGCYALDSWAAYFSSKHVEMLNAIRERTGDPLAQPSAEELSADQMILQGVLRKLCMESGKCVVIADQIPARGKETKEDNEIGRVLPMTASGLEYFVDVMVEVSLQERAGEIVRVFQVIKSNSPAFEVGFELTGNVTFKDFMDHMKRESGPEDLEALAKRRPAVPETIAAEEDLSALFPPPITIEELIAKATEHGFKQSDLVTAARVYHNQTNLYKLNEEQVADLDRRMSARIQKSEAGLKRQGHEAAQAQGSKAAKAASAASVKH